MFERQKQLSSELLNLLNLFEGHEALKVKKNRLRYPSFNFDFQSIST